MTTTMTNDTLAALEAHGRKLQKLSFNALCMRISKMTGEIPMNVQGRLRRLGHTASVAAALRSEVDPEAEKRFVASRQRGMPTISWGDISPEATLRTAGDESDAARIARLEQATRDAFGLDPSAWPGDLLHTVGHLAEQALELQRQATDERDRRLEPTAAQRAASDGKTALAWSNFHQGAAQ